METSPRGQWSRPKKRSESRPSECVNQPSHMLLSPTPFLCLGRLTLLMDLVQCLSRQNFALPDTRRTTNRGSLPSPFSEPTLTLSVVQKGWIGIEVVICIARGRRLAKTLSDACENRSKSAKTRLYREKDGQRSSFVGPRTPRNRTSPPVRA